MDSIIDIIFAACCGIMYGMGDLFGQTYEFVNVILFCYVEPALTVLMALVALYVLLKGPFYREVGEFFKWLAIAVGIITFVLFIASGIHALHVTDVMHMDSSQMDALFSKVYQADPNPFIHKAYKWTYDWLIEHSSKGAEYARLNLLVYILFMPSLIITSIIICSKSERPQNKRSI